MAITVNFDIAMPNEPYVDDFSEGKTHPGVYKGPRFLKVEKQDSDGLLCAVVADGDTEAELENGIPARAGTSFHVIDAQSSPLEASYINGFYETGEVPDYTEDLGTTDEDGNAETWTYYWNDNTGIINQIYFSDTLFFTGGNFVGPQMRTHALTRESFFQTVPNQKESIQKEIDENPEHNAEKIQELKDYITWLEGLEAKYADVAHWKIPFKSYPDLT